MNKFLLLMLLSTSLKAGEISEDLIKMQLNLDKNNPDAVEDIYDNNEQLSTNSQALERLALAHEKRNKFKEASEIYKKLIINFNQDANKKIITTNPPIDETLYTTNKLPYYYFKLAYINAQLFALSNKYTPIEERNKYKKNAEGFIALLKKVKADESDIKLIQTSIQDKIKIEDDKSYKPNWYISLGFMSWQDNVYLKNLATAQRTKLLSTAIGTSVGVGKKWRNSKYEFNLEGLFSSATSTISSTDANVNYLQSSVGVKSLILGPGFYYKGFSEKVYLGIEIPFSFRTGDWTIPEGNYEFENDKQFGAGYFFQIKYYFGKLAIQTRLGKIFPNPASHWSIGGLYDF